MQEIKHGKQTIRLTETPEGKHKTEIFVGNHLAFVCETDETIYRYETAPGEKPPVSIGIIETDEK